MLPIPILLKICGKGNIDIVNVVLISKYISTSFDRYKDYYLKYLPYIERHTLFVFACRFNEKKYIDGLLRYVNPSILDNKALEYACSNDNIELIERLLEYEQVKVSIKTTNYLLWANRVDTLKYLFKLGVYTLDHIKENFGSKVGTVCSDEELIAYIDHISGMGMKKGEMNITFSKLLNSASKNCRKAVVRYMLDKVVFTDVRLEDCIDKMISNKDIANKYYIKVTNQDAYYEIFVMVCGELKKQNNRHFNLRVRSFVNSVLTKGRKHFLVSDLRCKMLSYLLNTQTDMLDNDFLNKILGEYLIRDVGVVKAVLSSNNLTRIEEEILRRTLHAYHETPALIYNDRRSYYYINDEVIDTMEERGMTQLVDSLCNNPNLKFKRREKRQQEDVEDPEFLSLAEKEIERRLLKKRRYYNF